LKKILDLFIIFDLIWRIFSFLYELLEHKIHLQLRTDSVILYSCFVLAEDESVLEPFQSSYPWVLPGEEAPDGGYRQLKSMHRKVGLSWCLWWSEGTSGRLPYPSSRLLLEAANLG